MVSVMGKNNPWPDSVDTRLVAKQLSERESLGDLVSRHIYDLDTAVKQPEFLQEVFQTLPQSQAPAMEQPQAEKAASVSALDAPGL